MQIHELTNTADLSSTDYVGVDNGTTTRRFDLGALIASIRSRLTNAETGITNLQTSVSDVQDDVADAQNDITGLDTRLDAAESSITSQGTRLTTAESDIDALDNSKVDKTTPLLNFDDTATDPLTDDGALANALRNLEILDDVIPSGGGSLYLKKVLTALLKEHEHEYQTLSNTTFPYFLYTTGIERVGRIATFKFIGVKNLPSRQWTEICTIPESFRPSMTIEQVYPLQANGAGTALLLSIQPSGVIRAYNYTDNSSGNINVSAVVTYICNGG